MIRDHNCIVGRRFGGEWRFSGNDEEFALSVDGNLRRDSGDAVREAAVCGLGIAHSTLWLPRKDIEVGSLVAISRRFSIEQRADFDSLFCQAPPACESECCHRLSRRRDGRR
jgi:DNA-binding transcriptional LysR family regulator